MIATLFRDAITLALIAFLAMVTWMLPHLNPPAADGEIDPPGSISAMIIWPEGNIDVDLWVDAPGEPVPVGYSNKGGLLWNLLRDDLGNQPDALSLNFENAFTRGQIPGDYRVNVHCYRCPTLPVEVELEVTAMSAEGKQSVIGTSTIVLRRDHEEKTGLAFTVGSDGMVDLESMTTLFKPLRAGAK